MFPLLVLSLSLMNIASPGKMQAIPSTLPCVRNSPSLALALYRLKVLLDAVHPHRRCIDLVKALGVLGEDRREYA